MLSNGLVDSFLSPPESFRISNHSTILERNLTRPESGVEVSKRTPTNADGRLDKSVMWVHPPGVDIKIVVSTWRDDGHIHSTSSTEASLLGTEVRPRRLLFCSA